jgi:chromosome segregation ATPase
MAILFTGLDLSAVYGVAGWAGWVLCAAISLLWYRLWVSVDVRSMRTVRDENNKLKARVDHLERQETFLKNRNDELNTAHARLHGEFVELRGQFSQLNIAFAKQGVTVATLMEELREERKLRDDQYMQWMREKAKNGDL